MLLSENLFEVWKSFKQLFHKILFAFRFEQNFSLFFLVCGFGAFTAAKGGFDFPFTLPRHKMARFPFPMLSNLWTPFKFFFVEDLIQLILNFFIAESFWLKNQINPVKSRLIFF